MPTISCVTCSRLFTIPHCRAIRGAKFCSMECRKAAPKKPLYVDGECDQCGGKFYRSTRSKIPREFCSHHCYSENRKMCGEKNTTCSQCGTGFWLKTSSKQGPRTHGFFCSNACHARFKSENITGRKNPNWRGKGVDSDGYRVYSPAAHRANKFKGMKLHQAVCCEALGVKKIPTGLHVHHRDCDVLNNAPENLSVLTASDHKWIHKQFGIATLWAFMRGKISIGEMSSWSDDRGRAVRILETCVTKQTAQEFGINQSPTQEESA